MKKPYAASTLKRKYSETGIPYESRKKLELYLTACANFYLACSNDDAWKVIRATEKRLKGMKLEDILDFRLTNALFEYFVEQRMLQDKDFIPEAEENNGDIIDFLTETGDIGEFYDTMHFLTTPLCGRNGKFTRADFDSFINIFCRDDSFGHFILPQSDFYDDAGKNELLILNKQFFIKPNENFDMESEDIDELSEADDSYENLPISFNVEGIILLDENRVNKTIAVPDDIFCYLSPLYYTDTPQTSAMESFLEEFCDDPDESFSVMHKLVGIIRDPERKFNDDIQEVIDLIQSAGFVPDSKNGLEGMNRLISLYMEMYNNTPLPINYGHTATELMQSMPETGYPKRVVFGPGMKQLLQNGDLNPDEMKREIFESNLPFDLRRNLSQEIDRALAPGEEMVINSGGTVVKGRKIGPNEPCPCGSGKKYKKCCGKTAAR